MIKYKSGYKYQLAQTYMRRIDIMPEHAIDTKYILLNIAGELIITEGYAWDGPSGPTIDTKNSLEGSLVHDALYQLIRQGGLSMDDRKKADEIAYRIWRESGMSKIRAKIWRFALNKFASYAADPEHKKPILTA